MKPMTAVAISGGIDSLVSAYLLQQAGHEVIGLHFITGYEKSNTNKINSDESGARLATIAQQLGIQVEYIDCRQQFQKNVIDYFVNAYRNGRTPNPCLVCNPIIKFGVLLDISKSLGAPKLATGHYVRIRNDANNNMHLLKGLDPIKDQSYFLAFLQPSQLVQACFPLGEMRKTDVKQIAQKAGLHPAFIEESQDICFINTPSYAEFLENAGLASTPGDIVNTEGEIIGEHKGLHYYTIGQRRGINCPASTPYYVLDLNVMENRLVVGPKHKLLASECLVEKINWITPPPNTEISVMTRIRYQHKAALSILIPEGPNTARVRFNVPQSAITPGQGAVFYQEDEILGGGWISK